MHKSCHSPVEKFPASKFIEVCSDIHFQVGQNGPHLASELLYLPWFGWKSRFCFPSPSNGLSPVHHGVLPGLMLVNTTYYTKPQAASSTGLGISAPKFLKRKKTFFVNSGGLWTVVIIRGRRGVSSRLGSLLHGGGPWWYRVI